MIITVSLDQLSRPQPGGIATYVRGLVAALASIEAGDLVGLTASDPVDLGALAITQRRIGLPVGVLTRIWSRWPLGVPGESDVVHATSLAGPFGGGRNAAVHSVAVHDLVWRDEPDAATARGRRFHEQRLSLLRRRRDVRVFTSSPGLDDRLVNDGFDRSRLHRIHLGVDDDTTPAAPEAVARLLANAGVTGPFTLYAGTREPRKNIERLALAHAHARVAAPELGPLVVVGPSGWGSVTLDGAVVIGRVSRELLRGLYRDATVVAYVPRNEGWGLPPVEALAQGSRVVASTTTPSVRANPEVDLADPLDVEAIADALRRSLERPDTPEARSRRQASVGDLTWRQCALDHLAGWRCE